MTEHGSRTGAPFPALADAWFTPRRFAALLAVFVVAAFAPVALGFKTFVFRDFGLFGYPLAYYCRECFWRGELPLWNPLNNCGLPFLAQWNTMVLYPPSLFYLLFPLPWSLNFFCLAHLFFAGLGMYFLARRWTGQPFAAAVAGVAFAFNGLTLNCLMWPNNIAALGWMPWVVWLVTAAWSDGGRRALVKAALAGALQMLTGAPEFIAFTWLIIALLWFGEWWQSRGPRTRLLWRVAPVVPLVTGLSAAQLLPFLDLLRHSHRGAEFATGAWSMPAWGLLNFLVPAFRTEHSAAGVLFQPGQYWTSSFYVSLGVLALALASVARLRQPRVGLLLMIVAVSLVLTLGDHGLLYSWVQRALPVANFMRFPIKFVVLAVFLIPLLAATALASRLAAAVGSSERDRRWDHAGVGFILLAVGVFIGFALVSPFNEHDGSTTLKCGLGRGLFLVGAFAAFRALFTAANARRRAFWGVGVLALIWLDVLTHAPWQNPWVDPAVLSPNMLAAEQLNPRPKPGESRALLTLEALESLYRKNLPDPAQNFQIRRLALYDNCNLLEGVPKVDGFFSLYLPGERAVHFRLFAEDNTARPGLADFLGVAQVTSQSNVLEWSARSTWLPLLQFGPAPVFLDATNTLAALMSERFDPRTVVFLPLEARNLVTATNRGSGQILSRQFSAHRITAQVQADRPSLMVVAQADYHPWKAFVDQKTAPIWRADHAFQAIEIPVGRHELRLVYRDEWFQIGLGVSVLTLLVCLAFWRPGKPGP